MAAQDAGKKRRRNRKARTEVSSDDDDDYDESPRREHDGNSAPDEPVIEDDGFVAAAEQDEAPAAKQRAIDPEQAFGDFYLKQATKEFASDLDKLRSAPDFKEGSIPVLIEALRQGRTCFGVEERRRVGEAGGAGG